MTAVDEAGRSAQKNGSSGVAAGAAFYTRLPAQADFDRVADPGAYAPLPSDWVLGVADVVTSTTAIAAGRYKAVNTAGAAVISALSNALGTLDFPFVFAGDGAAFAVPGTDAGVAEVALAATMAWVRRVLGLELRGGLVGVDAIRAAGRDLRVARFAASPEVAYAMFSGGGRDWAEAELKAGRLPAPQAPPAAEPDLSGLSCRFDDIAAEHGCILSLIVKPAGRPDDPGFLSALAEVLSDAEAGEGAMRPLSAERLAIHWPPPGLAWEAEIFGARGWPPVLRQGAAVLRTLAVRWAWGRARVGRFEAARYRRELVENSDFRKFDDGLLMTIDCTPLVADRIESHLLAAQQRMSIRFGLHRQDKAQITCVVPSALRPDHVHFVDGAAGGYAMAARDLKRRSA